MSIKTQFATAQRKMLSETIEVADSIANGETSLKQMTNARCRRLGDQFAASSAVLDMCADGAARSAESPAIVGLYRRLGRDYRSHAHQALMISGEFESINRATLHLEKLRHMMRGQLRHFDMDARILFDASMQQVDADTFRGPVSCQPAG